MERKLEELKIAVVHDHLEWKGGGERTSLLLAKALNADYITAYASAGTYLDYQKELGDRFKTLTDKPMHTRGVRFFWLRWLFWRHRKLLRNYDVLIASGQPAMEAVAAYANKKSVRLLYNHTPPRRVFDLYEESRRFYPPVLRPLFSLFIKYWRVIYLQALDKMDFDIANSETVRQRMVKYTGRDVNAIIPPPIITDKFKWVLDGDYFLSWARLDEAKRVELIVEAFVKMPDKKLVVASTGIRLEECKRIAGNATNISFVGAVPDEQLFDLVGRCQAAIYIPINEDAGMTHLEANAAGKPILGVNEGGLIDTIIENETGIKIKANPTVEDVIDGIKKMSPAWCASKKEVCARYAANFSYELFAKRINEAVLTNHPDREVIGVDASRWEDPRYPGGSRRSGVEIYSWHLIENLVKFFADKPCRLRLYVPRVIPELPLTIQKAIPPRKFWTLLGLRRELKRLPPNRFFTPAYSIPAYAPKKSFAVIHDLAFETAPHRYSLGDWLRQEMAWSANCHRAQKLIAVSRATLSDIVHRHPRFAKKAVFVPPGYIPDPLMSATAPKRHHIVYVGRLDKKKSVTLLIKAFNDLANQYPDWSLDIVGGDGLGADEIYTVAKNSPAQNRIIFHGYASEVEKARVLGEAMIFVQPGSAEGSALSLLEAWDAGAAAIVADIPVMREIGENAALYFISENIEGMKEQITRLINDSLLRSRLIAEGHKNLKKYLWTKTAEEIGKIILQ